MKNQYRNLVRGVPITYRFTAKHPVCPADVIAQLPRGLLNQRPLQLTLYNINFLPIRGLTIPVLYLFTASERTQITFVNIKNNGSGDRITVTNFFPLSKTIPSNHTLFVTSPNGTTDGYNLKLGNYPY
ncbi:hypothetical protein [Marininema halotolerans]|uniref:Uncharacterized protein n=1 Tax=Marininema halotolerans TaxID=1155944 RepID=A0A1I6TSA0_9BACL|nr:hypothetical protein [Marininema halotolerans]SFS92040.1 hypothetical protein SAMN05444972_11127 [Marininema halotolerans]